MEAPISRSLVYFALISGHSLVTETKTKRKLREPLDDMLKRYSRWLWCACLGVYCIMPWFPPPVALLDFINIEDCVYSLALYDWLLCVYRSYL